MKKYNACLLALALICLCVRSAAAQGAEKHPFTPEEWASLRSAQPVAVAPDGATILYRVDFGNTKGPEQHEWKLIAADGSNPRALKLPEHFTPFGFTRDGSRLYGSFEKDKHAQLAAVAVANPAAAPEVLTSIPSGISRALISPDGSRFVLIADPRPPDPLAEVRTVVENQPASLYVINADGSDGSWWCTNRKEIQAIAWSPDGQSVAVLSKTPMIGFHYVNSSIDVCSASGARSVARISNASSSIAWMLDGKALVFVSTTTDVLTPDHVWTVPVAGGKPVDRTPGLAGSATDLLGDSRGNVWVFVARGVRGEVDSFAEGALKPAFRWPDGSVPGLPVAPEIVSAPETLAFSVGDPDHSSNVAVADGTQLKRITTESDDQLAATALGPVKVVDWKSKEGIDLEGIATFPPGFVEGKKYPFLVFPHGGPEANDFLGFDSLARFISGLGYVVLQPEYRGSTGYGSAFLEGIYQHSGDRAYRDVDSATDFAIARGWADPHRLAIFGWSAGGFLTSWTVTQTPRYRAAIEGAGITDWLSFIWTSDVQQIDYDARWPDQDPNAFLRFSAVMHTTDVSTPLLILHGAADNRVPTYQGREFYLALAARGKVVRMVTYPGSPHSPILWEQRQDVLREIAAWLARYNP